MAPRSRRPGMLLARLCRRLRLALRPVTTGKRRERGQERPQAQRGPQERAVDPRECERSTTIRHLEHDDQLGEEGDLHTLNQPAALSNLHDALNSQPETPRCACKNELIDLLARTLDGIENVSTLIVGPRGAGKHRLLSSVLRQFAESSAAQGASSYADPAAAGSSSSNKLDGHGFLRVDLHPMLVPDEPTALMAIASQLRVSGLEHSKGSFCDGLRYLLHLLRRARPGASGDDAVEGQSQPVVFVLHSFESFCQRPKQTLLYSLFDLMQTEDAQMAVIGLTTRMDVAELLGEESPLTCGPSADVATRIGPSRRLPAPPYNRIATARGESRQATRRICSVTLPSTRGGSARHGPPTRHIYAHSSLTRPS